MTHPTGSISLDGTHWKCTDEDMSEYGMTATIISGCIDPDANGDNDVHVRYQDGSTIFMKWRRFQFRFKQVKQPDPINVIPFKPKRHPGGDR